MQDIVGRARPSYTHFSYEFCPEGFELGNELVLLAPSFPSYIGGLIGLTQVSMMWRDDRGL